MPITIQFEDEEARRKGAELVKLIDLDIRDRQPQINTRAYCRGMYYGQTNRKLDYEGQSNIHLPVAAEKVEATTPKLSNGF